LGKSEAIGEKELLAEERVEEGVGETGISEENVHAEVVTKCGPYKETTLTEQTWADRADTTAKTTQPGSCWKCGPRPHLRFKAGLESSSCQKNRYGRQAMHVETPMFDRPRDACDL
jgi:hypothetical protein